MQTLFDSMQSALGLGLEPKSLTFLQISLRGFIVFIVALVLARVSDRRGLTRKSPFDLILVVCFSSVLARAINGSSAFFPSLGGAAVLVLAHRLLAFASCRWRPFAVLVKGRPSILVRDGELQRDAMRRRQISDEDLHEDMRLGVDTEDLAKVKIARLEVSGDVSFILSEDSRGAV